jgi:hypothetical protein
LTTREVASVAVYVRSLGKVPPELLLGEVASGARGTWTRVAKFVGGFAIRLNQLSGETALADECFQPSVGPTFVPSQARGQAGPTLMAADRGKTIKFQVLHSSLDAHPGEGSLIRAGALANRLGRCAIRNPSAGCFYPQPVGA